MPNHKKKQTYVHYMKKILDLSNLLIKDVKFVHVPYYAELKPENILTAMQLEKKNKQIGSFFSMY